MSPEFILRPSLSGIGAAQSLVDHGGVAGVYTPAFVERKKLQRAGAWMQLVSPEFILRPSLSEEAAPAEPDAPTECRRSLYSGLR